MPEGGEMQRDAGSIEGTSIAAALAARPPRAHDLAAEVRAFTELTATLAAAPRSALQKLTDVTVDLGLVDSAGISIARADGAGRHYHWPALSGAWANKACGGVPIDAGPCSAVVARDTPLLYEHPERIFAAASHDPPLHEVLLVPFHVDAEPVGTLWAIAHRPDRKFDAEDARVLAGLAGLASVACRLTAALDGAETWRSDEDNALRRQAIEDSEKRYRAFVTASADAVYRMSPDWSQMRQLHGQGFLSDLDAASADWLDRYILPDDHDRVRAAIDEAIATKSMFELEHAVRRADGTRGWTLSRAVPILSDDGGILEWLGTASDHSERRDAEEQLRESKERQAFLLQLSDALRSIGDPVEVQDEASRLLGTYLQASRVLYVEIAADGDHCVVHHDYADGVPNVAGRHALSDYGPDTWHRWLQGETVANPDVADDGSLPADRTAGIAAAQVRAWIGVPLLKDGRLCAILAVHQSSPRDWSDGEIELVRDTAERTWAAVERARAELRQRESEERLRQFGENSPDTLWILDAGASRLDYISSAYERMWGEPRERVMNDLDHWREHIHPADRERVAAGLPRLLAGERHSVEYRIVRPDGEQRWIFDTGFPIKDDQGRVIRLAGVAQDLTARREAEDRVTDSERRFRTLSEGVPQLVWRAVDHGEWSWASPQWTEFTGQSDADSHGWGWLDPVHADDRAVARAAWHRSEVTGTFEADIRLRRASDGRYRWFTTRATAVRDDRGDLVEWLGTSTDVDDLRRLQGHQQLLLGELQHRVRNSLAVIRSIARRSAATSDDVDDLSMHLDGRLASFARTQAAVTRNPGGGLDLGMIVFDELLAHGAREGQQAHVEGPVVSLAPKVGETLALAFHELATNAVKYGALALADGLISVSWRLDADRAGTEWLAISWDEERPGEPVSAPTRRGFGTELLEDTLSYELDAETLLVFRPQGLLCTIRIPLVDGIVLN